MPETQTTPDTPLLTPTRYEWEQLWHWHHEQQFECAEKEDYASAEDHKRRSAEIKRIYGI